MEKAESKIALITGSTGYIGSQIAKRLISDGWKINIVIRSSSKLNYLEKIVDNITVYTHDGTTHSMIEIFRRTKPKVIFHLASYFIAQHNPEDIKNLVQSNLLFGTQILEAMAETQVTYLINTGTSWQHFQNSEYSPANLYAATKQAFEMILEYYIEAFGIRAITLKLFDTYGPGDNRPKLFNILKEFAMSNKTLDMSPGEQTLDLVHINDVVEAFCLAAQRLLVGEGTRNEMFAVFTGEHNRLKDIVSLFERINKKKLNIRWGHRPYRNREVMNPWKKGKPIPGWYAKINLENGIASII